VEFINPLILYKTENSDIYSNRFEIKKIFQCYSFRFIYNFCLIVKIMRFDFAKVSVVECIIVFF
jgi:hypothetical protein